MDFPLIALVAVVGAGLVLVLMAWRAVRFMMRLALIGVFVLLLLAGAFFWWSGTNQQGLRRPAATTTSPRRANN